MSSHEVCAVQKTASSSQDVMPTFLGRRFDCHRPGVQENEKSGLDRSTYKHIVKGT